MSILVWIEKFGYKYAHVQIAFMDIELKMFIRPRAKKTHTFRIVDHEIFIKRFIWLQILYLRKFPKLKTLNISNNPVCQEENFKQYVAAFLPHLDFLDYRLLDEQTVCYIYVNLMHFA